MSDSTLILRGKPKDPTPDWVGDPAREGAPAQPPPWLARTEAAPVADGDETMTIRRGARAPRFTLLVHERALASQLARHPAWSGRFDAHSGKGPLGEARALCEAIAAATPSRAEHLASQVEAALQRGGSYRAPIDVVAGELIFEIDEVARLRATLPLLLPLAAARVEAAAAVRDAKAVLEEPSLDPVRAASATHALWAVHDGSKAEQGRLQEQVDRGLVMRRAMQRGTLFGKELLRGCIFLEDSGAALDVYVSASMLEAQAVRPRFRCRALVALGTSPDHAEPRPVSALILALAEARSAQGARR